MELPPVLAARYSPLAPLGRGGMAAVIAARDTHLNRTVAIKVLLPEGAGDLDVERLLREARGLAALTHPNIVKVFDHGKAGDMPFVVLELIEGPSLEERLRAGPLSPEQAVAWLVPLLDALAQVHGRGLLHRDIKPANIVLRGGTSPVLIDFGIALDSSAVTRLTAADEVVGTLPYLAPELLTGATATAAADLHALAQTFLYAITGVDLHRPDRSNPPDVGALLSSLSTGAYFQVATRAAAGLGALGQVLLAALVPDPRARLSSAAVMRDALVSGKRGTRLARALCAGTESGQVGGAPAPEFAAPVLAEGPSRDASSPGGGPRGRMALVLFVALGAVGAWLARPRPAPVGPAPSASAPTKPPAWVFGAGLTRLRLRALENAVCVQARSPVRAVVAVRATATGGHAPAAQAAESAPAYVHRVIVRGLAPETTYRVELEVTGDEDCPPVNAVIARTAAAGLRRGVVAEFRAGPVPVAPWMSASSLRTLEDADLPEILEQLRRSDDYRMGWLPAIAAFEELASPVALPVFVEIVERGRASAGVPVAVVERALGVLEATGGDAARVALERVLSTPATAHTTPERAQIRLRACRALALIAPDAARRVFASRAVSASEAVRGAAWLGDPGWRTALAGGDVGLRPALAAACLHAGGAGATGYLTQALRAPEAGAIWTSDALDALGAWGGAREVPAVARWVASHGPDAPDARFPSFSGLEQSIAAAALCAMAGRGQGAVPIGAAVPALIAAGASPDPRVQSAVTRALAMAASEARRAGGGALEAAMAQRFAAVDSRSADAALGLARLGTPGAEARLRELLKSERATDLWIAAVGAAHLPEQPRELLLDVARRATSRIGRAAVRTELEQGIEQLRGGLLGAHPTWVWPCCAWVSTGVEFKSGDRVRVEARGVISLRGSGQLPVRSLDLVSEAPATVYPPVAPAGAPPRERVEPRLIARIGRQELAELEPGAELIVQDPGLLQVRIAPGPFGDPWELTSDALRRAVGENAFGLVLVTVERF